MGTQLSGSLSGLEKDRKLTSIWILQSFNLFVMAPLLCTFGESEMKSLCNCKEGDVESFRIASLWHAYKTLQDQL